ncbi:hypothetical protein ACLOJK_010251 [Asimina triloba]
MEELALAMKITAANDLDPNMTHTTSSTRQTMKVTWTFKIAMGTFKWPFKNSLSEASAGDHGIKVYAHLGGSFQCAACMLPKAVRANERRK